MNILKGLTKMATNAIVAPVNLVLDVTMINPLISMAKGDDEFTDWFKSIGNVVGFVEGLGDITKDDSLKSLVERAQNGDEEAIAIIYQKYRNKG